jgi:hypothetical protein
MRGCPQDGQLQPHVCYIDDSPYHDPSLQPLVEQALAVADGVLRANFLGAYSWVLNASWAQQNADAIVGTDDWQQYTKPAWQQSQWCAAVSLLERPPHNPILGSRHTPGALSQAN